jgi:hypothetical protein
LKKDIRAFEIIRDEGIKACWIKFLDWTRIYRRLLVFERDHRKESLTEPDIKVDFETRLLKEDDASFYTLHQPDINASEVITRLRDGHLCFVTMDSGAIIGHTWSAFGKAYCEYLDCYLMLPDNTVYNYDIFISPDYRGNRIAASQYLYKLKYLLKKRYYCSIGLILPENGTSIKHTERLGDKKIGIIGYFKVGGWKKYFYKLKPEFSEKQVIKIEEN